MWRYRQVQIEDDKAVSDSGTLTVDLNVTDPLTALIIRFKAKNGTSRVLVTPPEKNITKIELVDGGQVYWSLPGPQAVAAATYGLGRWPRQMYDERANNNQRIDVPILFGRYLGDERYAFHPKLLTNPQLKITWADVSGYLDNYVTIGITAQVMEGLVAPPEILAWKEIEAWTTAASGEHKVALPVDYVYRALLMRPYLFGDLWGDVWTRFKLDFDVGKFIAFDLEDHELGDILRQEFGPYVVSEFLDVDYGTRKEAFVGEAIYVAGTDVAGYDILHLYSAGAWNNFYAYVRNHDGTELTARQLQVLVTGFYPHSCLLWPFGRWMDPETWMNPKEFGQIDLKLTEGVASAAGSVAIQQVRPIP